MRGLLFGSIVGIAMALSPAAVRAQGASPYVAAPLRMNGYFAAPGLYGMSYGSASYGMPRTYTSFSSPYGGGYGYGYAPYGLLPGKYGVGLWRPGFESPGYVYGASYYYRTFAVPYTTAAAGPLPPVGAYAPGFGPPTFYGW
jgi:hypothetical protein